MASRKPNLLTDTAEYVNLAFHEFIDGTDDHVKTEREKKACCKFGLIRRRQIGPDLLGASDCISTFREHHGCSETRATSMYRTSSSTVDRLGKASIVGMTFFCLKEYSVSEFSKWGPVHIEYFNVPSVFCTHVAPPPRFWLPAALTIYLEPLALPLPRFHSFLPTQPNPTVRSSSHLPPINQVTPPKNLTTSSNSLNRAHSEYQ